MRCNLQGEIILLDAQDLESSSKLLSPPATRGLHQNSLSNFKYGTELQDRKHQECTVVPVIIKGKEGWEELNDFKGKAVAEADKEIPTMPKSVAFEDSMNNDKEFSIEEEEEDLAIEFDGNDEDDDKSDRNDIDREENDAIVSKESADDYYDDDEYEYEEDDSEDRYEDNDKMDPKDRTRFKDLYGFVSKK